jgi:hypothetical protein
MDWENQAQDREPYDQPPSPPQPSRGRLIWRASFPPLIHMGTQVVMTIAGLIAVFFVYSFRAVMSGDPALVTDFMPDEEYIASVIPQVTIYALFLSALVSIILFYFMYKRYKRDFTLNPLYSPSVIPLTIVVALTGNFAVMAVVTAVQEVLDTDLATSSLDAIAESIHPVILILTVCIAVPIAEELCFRGLMFNHLSRAFPFWTANIIQASIFGLIHGLPIQIAYAFCFGLLLGWMVRRTGRLSIAVIAHIVFNSAFIPLGFIPGIEDLMENPSGLLLRLFLPSAAVMLVAFRAFDKSTALKKND